LSFWTDEGRFYHAIVMDLFNREIVGWSLKSCMTADSLTDALSMAWSIHVYALKMSCEFPAIAQKNVKNQRP